MVTPSPTARRLTPSMGVWAALVVALVVPGASTCVDTTVPTVPELGNVPAGSGLRCAASVDAPETSLRMHFVDVGQGDAIWLETPDDGDAGNGEEEGFNVLIDTGRLGFDDDPGTGHILVDYMVAHGLEEGSRIDWLIITHAHADHYGGARQVMDAFNVVNFVDPGFDNDDNSSYLSLLTQAENETSANGGAIFRPAVGTLFPAELAESDFLGSEIEVTVLNSEDELRLGADRSAQINNTSIALALEFAGVSVLLMGDAEAEDEAEIIAGLPDLRANILKVGHHGSTSSTTSAFLQTIFEGVPETRRFAVIMSGRTEFNGTTLPAASTVSRLLDFIQPSDLFSTQLDDEDKSEREAPGDDHVQAVIEVDGNIDVCYAP